VLTSDTGTTRGFDTRDFAEVGRLILRVLAAMRAHGPEGDPVVTAEVRARVRALCAAHPIYAD